MPQRFPRRILARLLTLVAVGALVSAVPVLGLAAPAQAHNYLVASTPAADSTLTELPEEFSIVTNEALLDLGGEGNGFALQVKDSAGSFYGDGCVVVENATMSTAAALGAAGTYTVLWQVVSADGHPVSGTYTFQWEPSDPTGATVGSSTAPACGGGTDGASAPQSSAEPSSPATDANVSDVLWIGGAVLAVGLAIGITLLVTSRKKK